MTKSNSYVAKAWASNHIAGSKHLNTDGQIIYSYGHVIGVTLPFFGKVAYDCHFSRTTTCHCSEARAVANSKLGNCLSCDPPCTPRLGYFALRDGDVVAILSHLLGIPLESAEAIVNGKRN